MGQFRRRILLINKPFQFRFALYTVSWISALSIIYPLLIYQLYEWFHHYLSGDPKGPPIPAIQESREEIIFWLIMMQLFFMSMTFLLSLFLSHRIAGPVYKIGKAMHEARNGKMAPVFFRKADHFKELAAEYNLMVESIQDSVRAARVHIEKAMDQTTEVTIKKELEQSLATLKHLQ
jgi:hypothetical protein